MRKAGHVGQRLEDSHVKWVIALGLVVLATGLIYWLDVIPGATTVFMVAFWTCLALFTLRLIAYLGNGR